MLFIGPMDISQSLGHPGDPAHPEVQQVVRQVIDTCNANKKPFGIFVGTTEAARKYRAAHADGRLTGKCFQIIKSQIKARKRRQKSQPRSRTPCLT